MLPNIDSKQCTVLWEDVFEHILISSLLKGETSGFSVVCKPSPSRPLNTRSFGIENFDKGVNRAPSLDNSVMEIT